MRPREKVVSVKDERDRTTMPVSKPDVVPTDRRNPSIMETEEKVVDLKYVRDLSTMDTGEKVSGLKDKRDPSTLQMGQKVVEEKDEHGPGKYFYIRSCMNNKLLTVGEPGKDEDAPGVGTTLHMHSVLYPSSNRQLFYFDDEQNIRSKINGYCLDSESEWVKLNNYDPKNKHAQWIYCGDGPRFFLKHNRDMVMDVRQENTRDDAEVIIYKYKGTSNQHFMLDYNITAVPNTEKKQGRRWCMVM